MLCVSLARTLLAYNSWPTTTLSYKPATWLMAFFNLTHLGPQNLFKTTSASQSDENMSSQRGHRDKECTREKDEHHTDTASDLTRDAALRSTSNARNIDDKLDQSTLQKISENPLINHNIT